VSETRGGIAADANQTQGNHSEAFDGTFRSNLTGQSLEVNLRALDTALIIEQMLRRSSATSRRQECHVRCDGRTSDLRFRRSEAVMRMS
jgi:hypothetical protein